MPDDITLDQLTFDGSAGHRQCKRCFMTGKACIYQHEIKRSCAGPAAGGEAQKPKAFMIMPFATTLTAVYFDQLEPCIKAKVPEVTRADDVMRTGFVICEKICKQIQEARVVCTELSADNANVFYELGLAYALGKPIAVFVQKALETTRAAVLDKLAIGRKHVPYDPFGWIEAKDIPVWQAKTPAAAQQGNDIVVLLANKAPHTEEVSGQKMLYSIDQLCRGGVHRAIRNRKTKKDALWRDAKTPTITFLDKDYCSDNGDKVKPEEVERLIRESRCVVICTDETEPCSYFWMGFAHGLEKDVIPITVISDQASSGQALPFDVRALWHIYFDPSKPADLVKGVEDILEILSNKDKDTKNRRQFWDEVLQGGSVSIFVGAVELTTRNRHVVGEWDYRAVSELSGFFSSLKETMETVIQTPVFQVLDKNALAKEKDRLTGLLNLQNSIIIASADVNNVTEVALATFAGLEPFGAAQRADPKFQGVVAFKNKAQLAQAGASTAQGREGPQTIYFERYDDTLAQAQPKEDVRGFDDYRGGKPPAKEPYRFRSVLKPYNESNPPSGYSVLYAHLAKFPLKTGGSNWAIVIQGISGPATLGLAQLLTGAKYRQFTIFDPKWKNDAERISLLKSIKTERAGEAKRLCAFYDDPKNHDRLPDLNRHSEVLTEALTKRGSQAIECIVAVFVADGEDETHDERRIAWWDFAMEPREMIKPQLS